MTNRIDEGSWAWRQRENNNRLVALQGREGDAGPGQTGVELAYFGASCFRITTPAGLTILIDPWRNPPRGDAEWFLCDFPAIGVDICLSTHAHFDHDGVHAVSAGTVIERPIGRLAFADATITGIADKHVCDSSHSDHDWAEAARRAGIETNPPHNWRSFDNTMILVETAGLRILHWGDNRPNPPENVWRMIGTIDIALLPIDGSQHVLSDRQAKAVARRLRARLIVPHHYGIAGLTTSTSTLLPPDRWVNGRPGSRWLGAGSIRLTAPEVARCTGEALCFGAHVAFETPAMAARADD